MNMRLIANIISVFLVSSLTATSELKKIGSNTIILRDYNIGTNGEHSLITNSDAMWPGVWKENTNGWRVQLYYWKAKSMDVWVSVGIGNTVKNTGNGFLWTPNEKFAKCELTDSNGTAIFPKKGMMLEDQFPSILSVHAFPRWQNGGLKNRIGFFTNSPPWILKQFRIKDVYQLKDESDYTLTVCPVIYKLGTNSENMAYRIDLPCITTKIHLKPNPKDMNQTRQP